MTSTRDDAVDPTGESAAPSTDGHGRDRGSTVDRASTTVKGAMDTVVRKMGTCIDAVMPRGTTTGDSRLQKAGDLVKGATVTARDWAGEGIDFARKQLKR